MSNDHPDLDAEEAAPRSLRGRIAEALSLFRRPQRLTPPMLALFAIIPLYLLIGAIAAEGPVHRPELSLDRHLPLLPAWSLVYLSLFLAALLPVCVVHQSALINRVVLAYLSTWLVAYACFLWYPTIAPTRPEVDGHTFPEAALRLIHQADVRYNCFPSLHVAQCVLAAWACHCVHRGVGAVAALWSLLVAISTLVTKQHYILDGLAGLGLAGVAGLVFLRGHGRASIPAVQRRAAPVLAMAAFGTYLLAVGIAWLVYRFLQG